MNGFQLRRMPKVFDNSRVTDAAYLDALIAEDSEASKEDQIAAEHLSCGEKDPAFAMDPVMDANSSDHADSELDIVEDGLLDEAIDDERTHASGESVGSGDHLMQNLVN